MKARLLLVSVLTSVSLLVGSGAAFAVNPSWWSRPTSRSWGLRLLRTTSLSRATCVRGSGPPR